MEIPTENKRIHINAALRKTSLKQIYFFIINKLFIKSYYAQSKKKYSCATLIINDTENFKMCSWNRMRSINQIKKKTNEEVLGIVKEKHVKDQNMTLGNS